MSHSITFGSTTQNLITNIDGIKIHKKYVKKPFFFRRRKNSEQKNYGFLFVLSIFGERRVFLYNGHDASVSTEFEGHCVGPLSLSVSCPNWWSFRAGQIISTKVFENQSKFKLNCKLAPDGRPHLKNLNFRG